MSSRALRKAQREREEALLEQKQLQHDEEDEDGSEDVTTAPKPQKSLFAMLEEDDQQDSGAEAEGTPSANAAMALENEDESADEDAKSIKTHVSSPNGTSAQSKRKKKKRKSKGKSTTESKAQEQDDIDEIDAALKSLSTATENGAKSSSSTTLNRSEDEVCRLLSVETRHLQVVNEMRQLFGRAAVAGDRESLNAPQPRLNLDEMVGLADLIKGKFSADGPGVPTVLRRRNIFVQAKEDWPRNTANGLSMEITQRRQNGITEYRFVHNQHYQSAEEEFHASVASMDPITMVNCLRLYPYHISTLLQVSEIAKQEKDPATSGELLERALFAFGKALHSTFPGALAQGKARLSFKRPENREFWLTAWRYISNISMKATWRTAYEWSRLLLALDPEEDPYCMRLIIDQLALRAQEGDKFVALCNSEFFQPRWAELPNIQYSKALAMNAGRDKKNSASDELLTAINKFPWVAVRLLEELHIDKIPPTVWGAFPETETDKLLCELYAARASDLWKLEESKRFLTTVVADKAASQRTNTPNEREVTIDEARHVILADNPALIALLPRSMTSKLESSSDPLPPEDDLRSYDVDRHSSTSFGAEGRWSNEGDQTPAGELIVESPDEFISEVRDLQRFFEILMPGLLEPRDGTNEDNLNYMGNVSEEQIHDALRRANIAPQELRARMVRLENLRRALISQPDQRVEADGQAISMNENTFQHEVWGDDTDDGEDE